jgi:hypothetical protein
MESRKALRRPASYSDSFLFLPETQTPLLTKSNSTGHFVINTPPLLLIPLVPTVPSILQQAPVETTTNSNSSNNSPVTTAEKWYSRLMGFGLHITLISLFETVFFFQYISKSEDTGIQKTVDGYINGVLATCQEWPPNTTLFLNDILSVLVNTTQVQEASQTAGQKRLHINQGLELQAWLYVAGLASTLVVVALLGRQARLRLAWKRILVENLIMVSMLGVYELVFFRTIIYNYDTMTVAELDEQIVTQLQGTCNLLTN